MHTFFEGEHLRKRLAVLFLDGPIESIVGAVEETGDLWACDRWYGGEFVKLVPIDIYRRAPSFGRCFLHVSPFEPQSVRDASLNNAGRVLTRDGNSRPTPRSPMRGQPAGRQEDRKQDWRMQRLFLFQRLRTAFLSERSWRQIALTRPVPPARSNPVPDGEGSSVARYVGYTDSWDGGASGKKSAKMSGFISKLGANWGYWGAKTSFLNPKLPATRWGHDGESYAARGKSSGGEERVGGSASLGAATRKSMERLAYLFFGGPENEPERGDCPPTMRGGPKGWHLRGWEGGGNFEGVAPPFSMGKTAKTVLARGGDVEARAQARG